MEKLISNKESEGIILGYIIKDDKIIKRYNDGVKEEIDYSLENEVACLNELKESIVPIKNNLEHNIESLKLNLSLFGSCLGTTIMTGISYADSKSKLLLFLTGTMCVITLKQYGKVSFSLASKSLIKNTKLKVIYRNDLVLKNNKLDDNTEVKIIPVPNNHIYESKNINELKELKNELIITKQEIENNINTYENNKTFEKSYELR